jgi:oligoendopeptidase F
MPTEKTKSASVTPITDQIFNLDEEIRRRAYELYEKRGRDDGHELDDWLRAEAELSGTAVKSKVLAARTISHF